MPAYALEPLSRLDARSVWMADGMPPEHRVPSAPGWRDTAGRFVDAAEDPDIACDFQLHVMSVLLDKGPWRLQQRQAAAEALARHALVRWRQFEACFALRRLHEHQQKHGISRFGRQALQPILRLRMRAALKTLYEHAAAGRERSLQAAAAAPRLATHTLRARSARRRTALLSWAREAEARRARAASWERAAAKGRARRLGSGLAALRAHAARGAARARGAAALARRRRRRAVDALKREARRRREWRWAVKAASDARALDALRALAAAARAPAIARARMGGWVRGLGLR